MFCFKLFRSVKKTSTETTAVNVCVCVRMIVRGNQEGHDLTAKYPVFGEEDNFWQIETGPVLN